MSGAVFNVGAIRGALELDRTNWNASIREVRNEAATLGGAAGLLSKSLKVALPVAGILGAVKALSTLNTGLSESVRLAIEFESSFGGVRKTVNATESEFRELASEIRKLARNIPVDVNELNRIAEAAGQLGIENKHLLDFTRTMAELGVTTNLTSESAATFLARWSNVTGLPSEQIRALGSTIVELGNNLATTEQEIAQLGLRIAGAGATIGLTDAEITGFAGTLTSLGFQAEEAGTAFSKIMLDMARAVQTNATELKLFAAVSGDSITEFTEKFRSLPADAMADFVEGLQELTKAGGNTFEALETLGFDADRVGDVLRRASNAGDLMRKSLSLARDEFKDVNALTDESNKKFAQTESQLTTIWNKFIDVGISVGQFFEPEINAAVGAMDRLAESTKDVVDSLVEMRQSTGPTFAQVKNQFDANMRFASELRAFAPTSSLIPENAPVPEGELSGFEKALVDAARAAGAFNETSKETRDVASDVAKAMDEINKESKRTASSIDTLRERGVDLHRSWLPAVDAIATVEESFKALRAASLLSDETAALLGEELWLRFQDVSTDSLADVVNALHMLDGEGRTVAASFTAAMNEAFALDADIIEARLRPELNTLTELVEGIEILKRAGRLTDLNKNLLAKRAWTEIADAGQEAIERLGISVDDIISKITDDDVKDAFKTLHGDIAREANDAANIDPAQFRLDDLQFGSAFTTAREELKQIELDVSNLIKAGEFKGDLNILAEKFWERHGDEALQAIGSIRKEVPSIGEVFEKTLKKMSDQKQFEETMFKAADVTDLLGNQLRQLGPEYRRAAAAATLASRIIRIQGALAGDAWAALTLAVEGVAEAFSLIEDKGEETKGVFESITDEIKQSVDQWADELTDAIIEFVKTGKFEFKEFVDSVLEDLLRITIREAILTPVLRGVGLSSGINKSAAVELKNAAVKLAEAPPTPQLPNVVPFAQEALRQNAVQSHSIEGASTKFIVNVEDHRVGEVPPILVEHFKGEGYEEARIIVQDMMQEAIGTGRLDRAMGDSFGAKRKMIRRG